MPLPRQHNPEWSIEALKALVDATAWTGNVRDYCQRTIPSTDRADPMKAAMAVYHRLTEVVRFQRDPRTVEKLRFPDAMIADVLMDGAVYGDCDESTGLGCAMLKSMGHRCAFVLMRSRLKKTGWNHIYPAAIVRGTVWPIDAQEKTPPGTYTRGSAQKIIAW